MHEWERLPPPDPAAAAPPAGGPTHKCHRCGEPGIETTIVLEWHPLHRALNAAAGGG